jgi:hypothetical protein
MRKLLFAFAVVLLASCAGKKNDLEVITNFYNAALGQTEMTDQLLKESLSNEVLSTLWEADYEGTYSWWNLRTGFQDGLTEESCLDSIAPMPDGWYRVAYTDMGFKAVTDVKMVDGQIADYKPFRVPFTYANGYFLRNDVNEEDIPSKIINQEELSKFFGMATVMGEDGKPTEVDFEKDFVIPVVYPETDQETTLVIERLWHTAPDVLTLSAGAIRGEEHRSFTIRPVKLIVVDNYYRDLQIDLTLN